jgi:hypothetical protein
MFEFDIKVEVNKEVYPLRVKELSGKSIAVLQKKVQDLQSSFNIAHKDVLELESKIERKKRELKLAKAKKDEILEAELDLEIFDLEEGYKLSISKLDPMKRFEEEQKINKEQFKKMVVEDPKNIEKIIEDDYSGFFKMINKEMKIQKEDSVKK